MNKKLKKSLIAIKDFILAILFLELCVIVAAALTLLTIKVILMFNDLVHVF